MNEDHERPTVNQPLHGERRSTVKPALMVLGILLVVLLVFVVLGWMRYNT